VSIPWNVVTLKNSVPADWITADHQSARPPGSRRPGKASDDCSSPPPVKKIEPTKNVTPVAAAPTSCA